jgi:acetyl esterase
MLIPKLQLFLDYIKNEFNKNTAFKKTRNQLNMREILAAITYQNVTNIDKSIIAVDDIVHHDTYPVPIRIYLPKTAVNSALPVAIFVHGGGGVCGSITVYDGIIRNLTNQTNHIIVAIEYRLAPEFHFPIGVNDCKAVIKELFSVLDKRQINYSQKKLALIGDSGGGGIIASITADEKFCQRYFVKSQVLIYPSVDYTLDHFSKSKYSTGYLLEQANVEWYIDCVLPNATYEQLKEFSPLFCTQFSSSMVNTLIIVGEYDPLYAEGVAYYEKMRNVGAPTTLFEVSGVIHAFFNLENLCPDKCAQTYQEIGKFLNS